MLSPFQRQHILTGTLGKRVGTHSGAVPQPSHPTVNLHVRRQLVVTIQLLSKLDLVTSNWKIRCGGRSHQTHPVESRTWKPSRKQHTGAGMQARQKPSAGKRKAPIQCEEQRCQEERKSYYLTDGTETRDNVFLMFKVQEFLASQSIGRFVNTDEFKGAMKIDLCDARNSWLAEALRSNPTIVSKVDANGGLLLKRKHPLDIDNDATLRRHLIFNIPKGYVENDNGLVMLGVSESELKGTYPSVFMDVDTLIEDGDVTAVMHSNGSRTLFPAVPGMQASQMCRDLWHSIKVPSGHDLRKEMLSRKLRTEEDYRQRTERDATRRRASQAHQEKLAQEAKQAKKQEKFDKQMEEWRAKNHFN